jgi:hypothetical protein
LVPFDHLSPNYSYFRLFLPHNLNSRLVSPFIANPKEFIPKLYSLLTLSMLAQTDSTHATSTDQYQPTQTMHSNQNFSRLNNDFTLFRTKHPNTQVHYNYTL